MLIDASWDPATAKDKYLESSPTIKDLPAVKNHRFVTIPFSSSSAGVRDVLAIEALAKGVN
jgi:iron complex transport system substrate-binding protein